MAEVTVLAVALPVKGRLIGVFLSWELGGVVNMDENGVFKEGDLFVGRKLGEK